MADSDRLTHMWEPGMTKREVLQGLSFGQRIAEEELDQLSSYFVETELWRRLFAGEIDIVYGAKGSGKSALYSLLFRRAEELDGRGVLVLAAENPRGATVFKDLVADPPATEEEFRGLWKLYFVALITRVLSVGGFDGRILRAAALLEEAGLLTREASRRGILRSSLDYVRACLRAESVEGGIHFDSATGLPTGVTGKITLREPSASHQKAGLVSADQLFEWCNEALSDRHVSLWVLLDRLDVAFAEDDELERNALRALFRVYLDLRPLERLSLKIFLRSDLWGRITKEGFREASHITRHANIYWDERSLLNLVVRRALRNDTVRAFYDVSEESILADADAQRAFFYRMFPAQVDAGARRSETFAWLLSRTRDGSGETAPRELIHMLTAAREQQLRQLELGEDEPSGDTLFGREALRTALPEVSRVRLEQTLFAEYPKLKPWLELLGREKTEQTIESLARIWRCAEADAVPIATQLVDVGFFEQRGARDAPTYWVPFLYRDALEMVQGVAE
jgi:hypothetical protein